MFRIPANVQKKRNERASKSRKAAASRSRALPKVKSVSIPNNFKIPSGTIAYQVRNRSTGKVRYLTPQMFFSFLKNTKYFTNYDVLMANPKVPLFNNVYPRNVTRVRARSK